MKNKRIFLIAGVIIIIAIIGVVFYRPKDEATRDSVNTPMQDKEYNPAINPSNFTTNINNKFFTLVPDTKFTYENKTPDGLERIEVVVTNERKQVMGVSTLVVRDIVRLDGELIEDTRDWYAQDKDGNVWYFGEDVDNYENGKLKDHKGAWEAGIDGAKPGIVMLANPKVGDSYHQEYYKGKAEDMGDIVALDKDVTVPYGSFKNCLQTRDWSQLDKNINEYKYYCSKVAFITMEEEVSGGEARVELIGVSSQ